MPVGVEPPSSQAFSEVGEGGSLCLHGGFQGRATYRAAEMWTRQALAGAPPWRRRSEKPRPTAQYPTGCGLDVAALPNAADDSLDGRRASFPRL